MSGLRDAILGGVLAGGQPLRQEEIAESFGASRSPVREALRQLEGEVPVSFRTAGWWSPNSPTARSWRSPRSGSRWRRRGCVIAAYVFRDRVFQFLLNASGAIALFVCLLTAISELILRRRFERENPEALTLRMWAYPYLTILTIVAFGAILICMFVIEDTRSQLILGLLSAALVVAAYYFVRRPFGRQPEGPARRRPTEPSAAGGVFVA